MKDTPVLEFEFQPVKLADVPSLIPISYRSKYEAIRQQVISRIRAMPQDETFMFMLPDNAKVKLDEKLINGICHGINTALAKEAMNWRIVFSEKEKAFVVAPYKRYVTKKFKGELKMSKSVAPVPVNGKASGFTEDEESRIHSLLRLVEKKTGAKLADLQQKNPVEQIGDIRRALLYIGRNALGIKLIRLGAVLNIDSGATSVYCKQAIKKPSAKDYVEVFSRALQEGK